MRYAYTKPLTQMAMFATLPTTTTAHTTEPPDHNQDRMMDNQNFIFLAGFTLMIALLANLIWHLCTKATKKATRPSQSTTTDPQEEEEDETQEEEQPFRQGTQTEYCNLDTLISLRRRQKELEAQVTHLQSKLQQAENRLLDQQACFEKDFKRYKGHQEIQMETMRLRYIDEVKVRARNHLRFAINANIHHTNHGSSWHSSFQCAQQRTANIVHTLVPCKVCAHDLGQDLYEEEAAQAPATSSSTGVNVVPPHG